MCHPSSDAIEGAYCSIFFSETTKANIYETREHNFNGLFRFLWHRLCSTRTRQKGNLRESPPRTESGESCLKKHGPWRRAARPNLRAPLRTNELNEWHIKSDCALAWFIATVCVCECCFICWTLGQLVQLQTVVHFRSNLHNMTKTGGPFLRAHNPPENNGHLIIVGHAS